jgi:hypothetical protein
MTVAAGRFMSRGILLARIVRRLNVNNSCPAARRLDHDRLWHSFDGPVRISAFACRVISGDREVIGFTGQEPYDFVGRRIADVGSRQVRPRRASDGNLIPRQIRFTIRLPRQRGSSRLGRRQGQGDGNLLRVVRSRRIPHRNRRRIGLGREPAGVDRHGDLVRFRRGRAGRRRDRQPRGHLSGCPVQGAFPGFVMLSV